MPKDGGYNANARKSVAGGRLKKGKRKSTTPTEDSNTLVLPSLSKAEKDAKLVQKRERLKQEAIEQAEGSKWNTKKRKRLEKYIDKKLAKEERVAVIQKLADVQVKLPASLTASLQSSATLGSGKTTSYLERRQLREDTDVRRAMAPSEMDVDANDEDESDGELRANVENPNPNLRPASVEIIDLTTSSAVNPPPKKVETQSKTIGSALKLNPDGSIPRPKTIKRKKKTLKWSRGAQPAAQEPDSESSFDTSDSAYDSPSDNDEAEGKGLVRITPRSESSSDDEVQREEEEGSSQAESVSDVEGQPPKKKLNFKSWALTQLSMAKGYVAPPTQESMEVDQPLEDKDSQLSPKIKYTSNRPDDLAPGLGPTGAIYNTPNTPFARHVLSSSSTSTPRTPAFVHVIRPEGVQESRLELPILAEEAHIVESILLNPVVIVCGETGSGKTTQVPQMLYERGWGSGNHADLNEENPGMIAITQPRRVAAVSMAHRVAYELGQTIQSGKVAYQIRYSSTTSPNTAIKFMTDGVLLRELASDFLLSRYSVVIVDEAHERSVNTDVLIGVLSRVARLREGMWIKGEVYPPTKDGGLSNKGKVRPLRLIIMSATLSLSSFLSNPILFPSGTPPTITIPTRQHPVTLHFNRRTSSDYVTEAIRKAVKIHKRLPDGGILIFLTGEKEIKGVCRKLGRLFSQATGQLGKKPRYEKEEPGEAVSGMVNAALADVETEDVDLGRTQDEGLERADLVEEEGEEDPDALDSDSDEEDQELGLMGATGDAQSPSSSLSFISNPTPAVAPMHIVPLYSLLPSDQQMRVFEPPPPGSRLVVVATNIAETSLTIPGIRYVIDCGRAKERRYDPQSSIQTFPISWISKASASQRAGRAGRTGPGHCYRLYSSALYEHYFTPHALPELLRMPIEGVVLQMKAMHIDAVVNFPFPSPPDREALKSAEKMLIHLGALANGESHIQARGQITDVGRMMSLFPLSPRFSRMLVAGQQGGCLAYVIAIVAALSVGDPFLRDDALEQGESGDEDHASEKEVTRLRRKAFFQAQNVHSSLGDYRSDVFKVLSVVGAYEYAGGGHKFCAEQFVRIKAMEEIHNLRTQINNIVETNFSINSTFEAKLSPPNDLQLKILRQLLTAALIDQVAVRKDRLQNTSSGNQYSSCKGVPYRALGVAEDVFVHPSSVVSNRAPPEYLVFNEIVRTSKPWMKGITVINPAWLASLGKGTLCTYSKPVMHGNLSMVIPHFGPDRWELPPIKAESH